MLDGIDSSIAKTQVTLRLPRDIARAMKAHCLEKQTHSKYVADLIVADLKSRPSDDPKTQFRGNW